MNAVKKLTATVAFISMMAVTAQASADCGQMRGCAKRQCEVSRQLEMARAHDNGHKAAGLERALADISSNCTDAGMAADLQQDIDKVNHDLAEHEQDLAEARAKGKLDKVRKYESKIAEDQAEIKQLEASRAALSE